MVQEKAREFIRDRINEFYNKPHTTHFVTHQGECVMFNGNLSSRFKRYFCELLQDPEEYSLFMSIADKLLPHMHDMNTWSLLIQNHANLLMIRDGNEVEITKLWEHEARMLTNYARAQQRLLEEPKGTRHDFTVDDRKNFLRQIQPFYTEPKTTNRFSQARKARLALNKNKRRSGPASNVITLKKTNLNH